MLRILSFGACALALGVLVAAAAPAAHNEAVPMHQRGLVYTLAPELPRPEDAARTDPRFLAAARYTTVRQTSAAAAAVLVVASLAALWLGGGASRIIALAGKHALAKSLLAAATVGIVVALWYLGAAFARGIALGAAANNLATITVNALCYGIGAFALAFAAAATRTYWPRTWWLALTFAAVGAAVASILIYNASRLSAEPAPPAGLVAGRAQYLAAQYEMPRYNVFVTRAGWPPASIRGRAWPHRRELVVTAGAATLGQYEMEVLLASIIARGEANRRAPLAAAALITFMASLLVGDGVATAIKRRRGPKTGPAATLTLFAAAFGACWLLAFPLLHTWNRHLLLAADADAVRTTRKPIAAVNLYYKEAAANMVAAEPNAVLHFLVDSAPSPAERAAQARRLRRELAR